MTEENNLTEHGFGNSNKPRGESKKNDEEIAKATLDAYGYCTNILRAWFGAYSIGVPALILSTDKLRQLILALRLEQTSARMLCRRHCPPGPSDVHQQIHSIRSLRAIRHLPYQEFVHEGLGDSVRLDNGDFSANVGTIIFLVIGSLMTFSVVATAIPK